LKRMALGSAFVIAALFVMPLGSTTVVMSSSPVGIVSSTNGAVTSTNWSGYAVTGASGSITKVNGSWVVPAVHCASKGTLYSSYWVGIDGFTSKTVEQTGTDSDCSIGHPKYYAWYEFYPSPSHNVPGMTVKPGDKMVADVVYSAGTFTVFISDITAGSTFSTSATVSGAARSSAEFIIEAPSICILTKCKLASLANFGTVGFGYDNTNLLNTCYLTENGVAGALGSFGSSVQQITMVDKSSLVKAQPSALSPDGTSFTVQWLRST